MQPPLLLLGHPGHATESGAYSHEAGLNLSSAILPHPLLHCATLEKDQSGQRAPRIEPSSLDLPYFNMHSDTAVDRVVTTKLALSP